MNYIVISIIAISATLNLQSQTAVDAKSLDALSFMIGEWEGQGWSMTRQGKEHSDVHEVVEYKLEGSIIVVEGLGTKVDTITGETTVVHHAFGVIHYDAGTNTFVMHAYKDGGMTQAEVEIVGQRQIRWTMDSPSGGTTRFTVDYSDPGRWIEIGEFSQNGENWMQFMGMELIKQ